MCVFVTPDKIVDFALMTNFTSYAGHPCKEEIDSYVVSSQNVRLLSSNIVGICTSLLT